MMTMNQSDITEKNVKTVKQMEVTTQLQLVINSNEYILGEFYFPNIYTIAETFF